MFTKTKLALAAALILGAATAAMAGDSGENHQDGGNSTGPNPFMSTSAPSHRGGNESFAFVAQPHVVKHRVQK